MADRVESFDITVPLGTAIATPQTTALTMRDAIIERVEIRIPPGPSGLVGFAILHSGQQVIPFTDGRWIISDNEAISWNLENYPTGDKWSVRAYNLDVYAHTLQFRFHLKEIPPPTVAQVQAIPIIAVSEPAHNA